MIGFDPLNVNLKDSNLIEASAGTGKTHIISLLYLRFLLGINIEKSFCSFNIDKLLVVTFTESATIEIKNRIFSLIKKLYISCIKNEIVSEKIKDLFFIIRKIPNIINLLNKYQNQKDFSSIFTIHGFCKKILFNNFFESKNKFYYKILKSEHDLIYKLIINFWRKEFYPLDENIIKIIIYYWPDPEFLFKEIINFFNFIDFKFKINKNYSSIYDCYKKIINEIKILKNFFIKNEKYLYKFILENNVNNYIFNKKNLDKWFYEIYNWAKENTSDFFFPKILIKFSYKKIFLYLNNISFFKKNQFFYFIDEFLNKKNDFYNYIINKCFVYVNKELNYEKNKNFFLSFNDLIIYLEKSINKENNLILINIIRNNFPLVLIDECQDIDFFQYNIFKKIYINNLSEKKTKIVFIGDPKQSIYSFRGANIFNYIKLKKEIKCLFRFNFNWRSSFFFIKSLNYLFNRFDNPFIFKEIKYFSVKFPLNNKYFYIIKNGKIDFSIKFFIFNIKNNYNYKYLLAKYCAKLIKNLLFCIDKKIFIINKKKEKRKIIGSDIAILVHSNMEVKILFDVFNDLDIPVTSSAIKKNIFYTKEAKDILFILKSILFPESKVNMSNALSTYIFGLNLIDIHNYLNDEFMLNKIISEFHLYFDIWTKYNIFTMIKFLLNKNNIFKNFYSLKNNKKYIINIIHIAEILQKKSFKFNDKMSLFFWLKNKIYNKYVITKNEYFVKSYNNDYNSIQILTIHKSKGLQYNIIFLPYIINLKKKKKLFNLSW